MALTTTEIELAYKLILGRGASQDEVKQIAGQYSDLPALRRGFLHSGEFGKKFERITAQVMGTDQPVLVHLHIPRTAGTTLAEALSRVDTLQPDMVVDDGSLDDLRALPRVQRRALRYVHGQLSMGAGNALGVAHRYMCMIRRPGPRIFSFYQFILRSESHPSHAYLSEQNMSFGDYLDYSVNSVPHRLELDNGQLRRLAGRFEASSIGQEQHMLKAALYAALSPDMLFGFVEEFAAFVSLLVDEGYLPDTTIETFNASPDSDRYQAALDSLTEPQKQIFESYTAWDTYVYDVCQAALLPE